MKHGTTIAAAIIMTLAAAATLQISPLFAADEADPTLPEPRPLIDCYELMDILMDPAYEGLKDATEVEPTGRKGWRALYVYSYSLAELANLLFSRTDEDYMGTPEWNELAVEMRERCVAIAEAAKAKDFPAVQKNYELVIQNCNACHQKFEPEDATEVKPW